VRCRARVGGAEVEGRGGVGGSQLSCIARKRVDAISRPAIFLQNIRK
jgi:hypothetical protein